MDQRVRGPVRRAEVEGAGYRPGERLPVQQRLLDRPFQPPAVAPRGAQPRLGMAHHVLDHARQAPAPLALRGIGKEATEPIRHAGTSSRTAWGCSEV